MLLLVFQVSGAARTGWWWYAERKRKTGYHTQGFICFETFENLGTEMSNEGRRSKRQNTARGTSGVVVLCAACVSCLGFLSRFGVISGRGNVAAAS